MLVTFTSSSVLFDSVHSVDVFLCAFLAFLEFVDSLSESSSLELLPLELQLQLEPHEQLELSESELELELLELSLSLEALPRFDLFGVDRDNFFGEGTGVGSGVLSILQ